MIRLVSKPFFRPGFLFSPCAKNLLLLLVIHYADDPRRPTPPRTTRAIISGELYILATVARGNPIRFQEHHRHGPYPLMSGRSRMSDGAYIVRQVYECCKQLTPSCLASLAHLSTVPSASPCSTRTVPTAIVVASRARTETHNYSRRSSVSGVRVRVLDSLLTTDTELLHFHEDNITILMDDEGGKYRQPTHANIVSDLLPERATTSRTVLLSVS